MVMFRAETETCVGQPGTDPGAALASLREELGTSGSPGVTAHGPQ